MGKDVKVNLLSFLSFEEWYSANEGNIENYLDQIGATRELDFDPEVEERKLYNDLISEKLKTLQEVINTYPSHLRETLSDGYHTFDELYEFRKVYNAALFNEWAINDKYAVHKSRKHYDGELCFGGEYFIVCAMLPAGQISNHYLLKDWGLFDVPATPTARVEFDGHTSEDVLTRLKTLKRSTIYYTVTDELIDIDGVKESNGWRTVTGYKISSGGLQELFQFEVRTSDCTLEAILEWLEESGYASEYFSLIHI